MRSNTRMSPIWKWVGVLFVAGGSGCTNMADDCEKLRTCTSESAAGDSGDGNGGDPPTECDLSPYDDPSVVRDECGFFVSERLGDDGNSGTMAAPVKTLAKALSLATARRPRVYACAEKLEVEETIQVLAGRSMFGGLDCANGWSVSISGPKTMVVGALDQIPMKLLGGDGLTIVAGFDVIAARATAPGGSSIAMIIGDVETEISYSRFEAGNAADGEAGAPYTSEVESAPPGSSGSKACLNVLPGNFGFNYCNGVNTSGGVGGLGDTPSPDDEAGVGDAGSWGNEVGGKGGKAHLGGGLCPDESKGEDGPNGASGTPGAGAALGDGEVVLGRLSMEIGFVGVDGKDGSLGKPGGGGGGGGGRPAKDICSGVGNGASGGGGGAGGCGGNQGKGGRGGGSSIALVSLGQRDVTFHEVELKAGDAGRGGDGGDGQVGVAGGAGGEFVWQDGCPGGKGGNGGKGGRGGGGSGGHALGIASKYIDFASTSGIPMTFGQPGAGGEGDLLGGAGAPGQALSWAMFPK